MMGCCRIDICFGFFFKRKTALLESADNLTARFGRNQDVIRKISRNEEDRTRVQLGLYLAGERIFGFTHIPARARGLVNSSTLWPASNPSPSTEITTKSSEDIVAVLGNNPEAELD